jgi:phospholipid/cholesterol/gamma-HCH transport system permease protein
LSQKQEAVIVHERLIGDAEPPRVIREPGYNYGSAVDLISAGESTGGRARISDDGLLRLPGGGAAVATNLQSKGLTGGVANLLVRLRVVLAFIARIPLTSLGTVGRSSMLLLAVVRYSVTDAISGRLRAGEVMVQAWTIYKVTALPALLMAIPFGAMVAVQASGLMNQVGANSVVGAASGVAVLRQGAPITAGLLMGGAAASAIASDLGARAIREELDALRVMGVDPVRHLVVPRFLGLILLAPVLCAIIIASAVLASFTLAVAVNDVTSGSFWQSFGAFAKIVDIWFAIAKAIIFAAIVGITSSLKGMEATGGPRGVADAVNAAVVLNVVGIVFANLAITQFETMFYPMQVA